MKYKLGADVRIRRDAESVFTDLPGRVTAIYAVKGKTMYTVSLSYNGEQMSVIFNEEELDPL